MSEISDSDKISDKICECLLANINKLVCCDVDYNYEDIEEIRSQVLRKNKLSMLFNTIILASLESSRRSSRRIEK